MADKMNPRKLWGITFSSGNSDKDMLLLLGSTWDEGYRSRKQINGEPSRALLFTTRSLAREWCKRKNSVWHRNGSLKNWHVQPVRVLESVKILK